MLLPLMPHLEDGRWSVSSVLRLRGFISVRSHQARSPHWVPGPCCQQQDGMGQVELVL